MKALLRMLALRLRGLWTRSEPRLDEEIETHLAMLAADLERRGLSPREAAIEARRQFGGVTQVRERYRQQRRLPFVDSLSLDLSFAVRQWRKSPLFAMAAVTTLALGIGANTAIFRMLDAVALRALPVADPARLVRLEQLDHGRPSGPMSYPRFRELTAHPELFTGAAAMGDDFPEHVTLEGAGELKVQDVHLVTGNYFQVFGVNCLLGRVLTEDDDKPGAPGAAVLAYQFWRNRMGARTDVLGRTLAIGKTRAVIVGVAPPHFGGERVLFTPDIWLPMSLQPLVMGGDWKNNDQLSFLETIARLQPGVDIRRVQAVLGPQYRRVVTRNSDDNGAAALRVVSAARGIVIPDIYNTVERPLWVLLVAAALLLLIACCNLANLLLARAAARTHEMGVRMALGAGRGRLLRQLFTESLLLTACGAAAGFLLVAFCAPLLAQWAELGELTIDTSFTWECFAFNGALCAAVGLIFGLAPALAGSRFDVRSALQANRRSYTGLPRPFAGRALVVAQMAICLTVLSGAALLGRSLWNTLHQKFGFREQGLLLAEMNVDWSATFSAGSGERLASVAPAVLERLNGLPGVRSAALSFGGPLSSGRSNYPVSVSGRKPHPEDTSDVVAVTPGYLETLGIPLLAGREIDASDNQKAPHVIMISETAARTLFGGVNPLGRYLSFSPHFDPKSALQVVGVTRDVRISATNERPGMLAFVPLAQQAFFFSTIALRTDADPGSLAPAVRRAISEADHNLTMSSIRPVAEILDDITGMEQTLVLLIAVFGALALLLAGAGIAGVLAYEVHRRTPEIGVRMALGATRGQVVGLVMRQVGRWLAAGGAIGVVAAGCAWASLRSQLFGVTAWDWSLVAAAGLVLSLAAAGAAFLPARRAARLNVLDGLRSE